MYKYIYIYVFSGFTGFNTQLVVLFLPENRLTLTRMNFNCSSPKSTKKTLLLLLLNKDYRNYLIL